MRKPLHAGALSAMLLLAAGCASADERTPTEADGAAAKAGPPSGQTAPAQASSLCAAYERRLAEHRMALARTPDDQALRQNVATFQTVLADACS